MVAGAFPIAKLAYLAIKQVSKPIANVIKNKAKSSPFFRTYVCIPPAQFYHWVEVNIKMRMLNLGKPNEVPKLKEAMAIELGAELLGEGILFTIAAGGLIAEYMRGLRNEKIRDRAREGRAEDLEGRVYELEYMTSEQEQRLKDLTHLVFIENKIKMVPPSPSPPSTPQRFPPIPPKPKPPSSPPPPSDSPPSPPPQSNPPQQSPPSQSSPPKQPPPSPTPQQQQQPPSVQQNVGILPDGVSRNLVSSSATTPQVRPSQKQGTVVDKAIDEVRSIMVFL